jgi:hypothetical protein
LAIQDAINISLPDADSRHGTEQCCEHALPFIRPNNIATELHLNRIGEQLMS